MKLIHSGCPNAIVQDTLYHDTYLEHRSHLAMERWGPTLLRMVAIIIVMTNWTPNTAMVPGTRYHTLSPLQQL